MEGVLEDEAVDSARGRATLTAPYSRGTNRRVRIRLLHSADVEHIACPQERASSCKRVGGEI